MYAKALAVLRELVGMMLQHAHGQHEQVVEVDGVRRLQRVAERAKHRRDRLGERIHRQPLELRRHHERVLRVGDRRLHAARREVLRRDAVLLHQPLDDAERIVLIVDRERRRATDEVRGGPQHPRADRVERSRPHARGLGAEQAADALAHLAGGLVRERHREDLPRVDAFDVDQSRDARRQHARLSRAGAGEDEQRAVDVQHGFPLRRVEPGGQFFIEQHRHQ